LGEVSIRISELELLIKDPEDHVTLGGDVFDIDHKEPDLLCVDPAMLPSKEQVRVMNVQAALLHPAEILPAGELLLCLERFKVSSTHLD
jgi:hypothetical protein